MSEALSETEPETIPAATLILLRDVPGGAPELPMVGRGAHLAFAANRMVFPGGRVDPDDRLLATRADLLVDGPEIEADELAHRIAAIRETIEEIGLAPGIEPVKDVAAIEEIRAALHGGEPLSAILERLGLRIDVHDIRPFARWLPKLRLHRRFDTRFYITRAPALGEAIADGVESSHCLWGTARQHLAAGKLIFPTICTLEWIAQAGDFAQAIERTRHYPVETVTPWIEQRDGEEWLCIPDGLGYPKTAQRLSLLDSDAVTNRPSIARSPG